jgi:hypothetical protein
MFTPIGISFDDKRRLLYFGELSGMKIRVINITSGIIKPVGGSGGYGFNFNGDNI